VRQTHDGGRSWKPVSLPRPPEVPASAEVSVGDYVVAGNSVLVSTQYQWTTGDSNAAASGYEFISRDQGHTWSLAWSGAPGFDSGSKVVAVNETTLFRFPDHGSTIRGIYTTPFTVSDDGGRTWTSANAALPSDTHFDSESFVNALDGWAILSANQHCPPNSFCPGPSPSGRLAETNDGGRTWRLLGPTENLSAT
jgi:photosystem II stability/assembly factor-like uncharacterized protein